MSIGASDVYQLGMGKAHKGVSVRRNQQLPGPDDEFLALELTSLLCEHTSNLLDFDIYAPNRNISMATSADTSQRPRLQFSQSFRTQATQDALAQDTPLARTITEEQGLHIPDSATAIASKLEGLTKNSLETLPLNEEYLHHRLNASGSVQAIAIDDDVLFAGLQGGEIVVCLFAALSFVPND